MFKIRPFFLIILFSLSALSADDQFFPKSEKLFQEKIRKVRLDNGLTMILMKRGNSPTLALYIKFKVGAVDETPEQAGTAHLLEHMLFKGTKDVGTSDFKKEEKYQEQIEVWGTKLDNLRLEERNFTESGRKVPDSLSSEISKLDKRLKNLIQLQDQFIIKNEDSYIYEQNGEVGFNAYTSQDVTNYQIQLPSNRLEIWAKLESDRLRDPILREYYTERDVVIEERRMRTEDSGSGVLRERFFSVAFESHPYRKPVIGYATGLPFLKIDETKKFFKENYTPNRMVIAIVGEQNFDETERIVRKYFSDLKKGKDRSPYKIEEKQYLGEKRVKVLHPSSPQMMLGWLKPAYPHRDNAGFDVLSNLLTTGAGARLNQRLVLGDKSATSVGSANGYPGERYANFFTLFVKPGGNADLSGIENSIWEELKKIEENGVSKEELEKVKNQMIADFLKTMDDNATIADLLSYYELLYGNWNHIFKQYETIQSVDSKEIQDIVKKYLSKDRVVIGVLEDSRKAGK
ncbi:M16 family metallopeptidase [Leptospira idonii]|uniref:Insulinase family protein n=1 Tax=Leptospira idonii TaxID=1193500 RepID=A0A4R9M081_9LEPT|nr:pitrilysin family protein [Leptospira idonii]TGN20114.1 insulinase family protein [Leptospira idonii]